MSFTIAGADLSDNSSARSRCLRSLQLRLHCFWVGYNENGVELYDPYVKT